MGAFGSSCWNLETSFACGLPSKPYASGVESFVTDARDCTLNSRKGNSGRGILNLRKMSYEKQTKMEFRFGLIVLLMVAVFGQGSSACTLPDDLRGAWEDSYKGLLSFTNTTVSNYSIHTFGSFDLTCYQQNGSTYIMESNSFTFFSLTFQAYFCWHFIKVTDDLYYFYDYAVPLQYAGWEKVKMYLPFSVRDYNGVCANTNPGTGTYRVLFRNNTLSTSISSCPSFLQSYYSFTLFEGGTQVCASSDTLDGCANSKTLSYNIDSSMNCNTSLAYTAGGEASCLFYITEGTTTYLTLYNNDATVDDSTTYQTTCMIIDSINLVATQYPKQCLDDQNTTYVASPGASVYLTLTGSCPTEAAESLLWVIGVVLFLLLIIAMICAWLLYRKKRRDDELRKKLELERAGDDGRADEDDKVNTRGGLPPGVTIAIMEGRSRGLKDMNGMPGFRESGDVTPSGIRLSYDAPHRRFSKRRRVWVIGDDGKVVKVWKERDGKESPDSGLEEDEADGQGGKGAGYYDKKRKEKEERDFQKQFGRKDVKESTELTEKGDLATTSTKMQGKIKKMAGVRSYAKNLKKRGRKSKSGKVYEQSGQELTSVQKGDSEYSTDEDDDDDDNASGNGNTVGGKEQDQNKQNEMKERRERDGKARLAAGKGGSGGGPGRVSPDSGTGRCSVTSDSSGSRTGSGGSAEGGAGNAGGGRRGGKDGNSVGDGGADGGRGGRGNGGRGDSNDRKGGVGGGGGGGGHGGHGGGSGTGGAGAGGGKDGRSGDGGRGGGGGGGGGAGGGGSGGDSRGGGTDGHGGSSRGGGGTDGRNTSGGDGGDVGGAGGRAGGSQRGGGPSDAGNATNDGRGGGGGGGGGGYVDGRGGRDLNAVRGGGGTTTTSSSFGKASADGTVPNVSRSGSAERSGRGDSRKSNRAGDKSSKTGTTSPSGDVITIPPLAMGSGGNGSDTLGQDTGSGNRDGAGGNRERHPSLKGVKSGGWTGAGKDSRHLPEIGVDPNVIQVTPRGSVDTLGSRDQKGQDQLSAQSGGNRNRFSTSQDSTVSTINANSDLDWANQFNQGLVAVETSRPPTGHQRRRGWFDHDSSSPDRASSAARAQQNDQNLSRSHSDRVMESRSVHWPERDSELEVPSTANTRRSVRWKEGGMNDDSNHGSHLSVPSMYMGTRRSLQSEASTLSRDSPGYRSMSRLALIHRKRKAVAPQVDDPMVKRRMPVQRPPDMDDLAWKRLLEELYPDKKYLDYAKESSFQIPDDKEEGYLHTKAAQGLNYLYGRAKYWEGQPALVRPGTSMSVRSVTGLESRAGSALPPLSREGSSRNPRDSREKGPI